nr:o-succinylbenzoate--CoA ligase [Microbacterium lemovicicum]
MNDQGLGGWLARRRLRSPDKAALLHGEDGRLTYKELADATERAAAVLASQGVSRGDRVAYLGENSPGFIIALFATVQLGAVFVPINTRLAPPEVAHILRDSAASLLVHDVEFDERLAAVAAEHALPPALPTTDGDGRPGFPSLMRDAAPGLPGVRVAPSDPAAIVYTSGTTGRPKGAILTHQNLTFVSLNCIIDYDVTSHDVALMISPLFHVASLGMGALPVLLQGGTLVLEKGFEPGAALRQIQRHRVTMLSGVPTTYMMMADHPDWATTDLSSLDKLTCGGSAVPTRILTAYEERGLAFAQGYGMTETSPGGTSVPPAMSREKQGSVGLPQFFLDVRVADEDGRTLPAGEVGEVQVSGPNVFAGYLNLPEATAAAFTADGWFRSGDLGYVDADGYLFISGRSKDMIISGGENIYPAEVENLLADVPGVAAAAVIGVPDDRWGEVPWAVVTVAPGAAVDTTTVAAFLDGKLARYKIPKRVVVVDELPRTASGKVIKAELRERFAA